MAYVQPSLFNPAGFPMMNINCRQAAQNQDIQMVGSVNNVGLWNGRSIDGATRWPQHQQQNGPQISDLHGTTVFTNGRKRSRENIECEEMKKAKTADSNHDEDGFVQAVTNVNQNSRNGASKQPTLGTVSPSVLTYRGTPATYGIDQLHDVRSRNYANRWMTELL